MLKNFTKTLILFTVVIGLLFSSEDLFLKKKIQIENQFRGQIRLNPDLFKIWIGTRVEANINSPYQIKKQTKQKTSKKEYIPGLPTIPSGPKTPSTSNPYSEFPYVVYVYIDTIYDTEALKNRMKSEIIEVWREINFCDECITFVPLEFQSEINQANGDGIAIGIDPEIEERLSAAEDVASKLEATMLELQEIKDANIAQERTIELQEYELSQQKQQLLDEQFSELEDQLSELQKENQSKNNELEDMKSFRMQYLEKQYDMHRDFQDSLLIRYGQKLDNIYDKKIGCLDKRALNFNPNANADCDGCCRYDTESPLYAIGCMDKTASNYRPRYTEPCDDCCIYDIEGCMDSTAMNYNINANVNNLGSCVYEESGGNWMIWLMISLLGVLITLSLYTIFYNKKKVVYLKPKDDGDNSSSNNTNESIDDTNNSTEPVQPPPAPPTTPPTSASVDEGVLQSEIRTQRQSAVAMSAGQKEGATQIVKDWMNESKNEEQSEEE
jgi:DNA-binding transcriptional MerR regulator